MELAHQSQATHSIRISRTLTPIDPQALPKRILIDAAMTTATVDQTLVVVKLIVALVVVAVAAAGEVGLVALASSGARVNSAVPL